MTLETASYLAVQRVLEPGMRRHTGVRADAVRRLKRLARTRNNWTIERNISTGSKR